MKTSSKIQDLPLALRPREKLKLKASKILKCIKEFLVIHSHDIDPDYLVGYY